jgi:hypothetical protein
METRVWRGGTDRKQECGEERQMENERLQIGWWERIVWRIRDRWEEECKEEETDIRIDVKQACAEEKK